MLSNISQSVFMPGIGGIGMSALARFLKRHGHHVCGYDRSESNITRQLSDEGIIITHEWTSYPELTGEWSVIYTPAIPKEHPVIVQAESYGCSIYKRSQVLGIIAENYFVIAVAGTHGKTTVTTMITHLLKESGLAPTAFIGGIANNFNSNLVIGSSEHLVVEADEYDRSFLTLHPNILILTALDPDHLDIYRTPDVMIECYQQLIQQIKPGGLLIASSEIHNTLEIPDNISYKTYGESDCHYQYDRIMAEGIGMRFDFHSEKTQLTNIKLPVAGEHNVRNMTAAIAVAETLGANKEVLLSAVSSYKGIKRRFDVVLHSDTISLVDDYAHHPREIEVTIQAARRLFPHRQLVAVFQPHLFTRTRDFQQEFADALSQADAVILTHIYPAREKPLPNVTCETIYDAIRNTVPKYVLNLNHITNALQTIIQPPAVVLIMGAGDIDSIVLPTKEALASFVE
jgi:UDP-N-acetylmuramate--alanine ligase